MNGFRAKYEATVERNRSLLCVGLDPDAALMPPGADVVEYLGRIIEATSDLVCCYKPNAAFFEPNGDAGWRDLKAVIERIPSHIPVLLDAKRGDVGNTSKAYARAVFDTLGADAVTANPYLGSDGLEPFFSYSDKHTFVLCRTSNEGARELQDLTVGEGRPLYEHVAMLAAGWNVREGRENVGLVVGATYPEEAARIREVAPDLLFLMPGVGAQAGDLEAAVQASVDAHGGAILVSASRSVLYAGNEEASRAEAMRLRDGINAARG
ncbi:MAG: orotidine-5'-phosphate decarboxylase [Chloroflexi bacterium]|nr:MAG: orotidine-5'-phosphate decarboxylase [Chloroflexota bacterium]